MFYENRFIGRKALVTGGAGGIGFAVADRLFQEGASVMIADIHLAKAKAAAEKIDTAGKRAFAMECDVASFESTQALANSTLKTLGGLDILVNCAGITMDKTFYKMEPEQWNRVIDVNLTGTYNVSRNVIDFMRNQCYGRIVNLSSTSARGPIGQANYAASKAGVIAFTKTLAKELAKYNITINAVLPTFTDTDMVAKIPSDVLTKLISEVPAKRLAKPEEQAAAICFLASEEASYVNGAALEVSGGF